MRTKRGRPYAVCRYKSFVSAKCCYSRRRAARADSRDLLFDIVKTETGCGPSSSVRCRGCKIFSQGDGEILRVLATNAPHLLDLAARRRRSRNAFTPWRVPRHGLAISLSHRLPVKNLTRRGLRRGKDVHGRNSPSYSLIMSVGAARGSRKSVLAQGLNARHARSDFQNSLFNSLIAGNRPVAARADAGRHDRL